ncbi:MAG: hypothetical protein JXA10_19525 [Anaerolineae bacterium]|nr:hypothetical protein [Anaerolineae bacterium]
MNHRWRLSALCIIVLVALVLAGCGDDKKDSSGGNGEAADPNAPTSRLPTSTPLPPPPREREEPAVDPYEFEPPFSVGNFVRESLRGNATAVNTGGLQATYRRENEVIVLKVYHFGQTVNAITTVEDTLNASTIVTQVSEIYTSPRVNFGIVQDKHGAYIAAWNHYKWAFIVSTSGSLDTLNAFLDIFQY